MDPSSSSVAFDEIHLGDIKGRRVIGRTGTTLGTIEDASFDPRTWRISGFVVSLRREVADRLRLGETRHGLFEASAPQIQIGAERVATFGENVILNVDADQIAASLGASIHPETAPGYEPRGGY